MNDMAEEEWYRQNRWAEDSDVEGPQKSNDEAREDLAQNVVAIVEMEWEDVTQLH